MAIATETTRWDYSGTGSQTDFPYSTKMGHKSWLGVYLIDNDPTSSTYQLATLQTVDSDYTVTGVGDASGGAVVFTAAPLSTENIAILIDVPLTQEAVYPPSGRFPALVQEAALDKLTLQNLKQAEQLNRSPVMPINYSGAQVQLPIPEANRLIGWGSAGDGTMSNYAGMPGAVLVSGFMETVVDDTDAETARETLGVHEYVNERPFGLGNWASDEEHPYELVKGNNALMSTDGETWATNNLASCPPGYEINFELYGYAPLGVSGTLEAELDTSLKFDLPNQTYTTSHTYTTNDLVHLINTTGELIVDGRYGYFSVAGATFTTIPTFPASGNTVMAGTTAELTVLDGGWERFAASSVGVTSGTTFALPFTSVMTSIGYYADRALRLRVTSTVGAVLTGCKVTPEA